MKTINLSFKDEAINTLLLEAHEGGIILKSFDGREFILAEIDNFTTEIELTRNNDELMKLLDKRVKRSGTIPLDEVKSHLGID